ncbi:CHASE4 domain-containing protein [Candidatus Halobeggiatoa sp. HSG11]|nr:CHASE4 domain-containing protein [Candidatus Halobeggiatoa sp. HSG11]
MTLRKKTLWMIGTTLVGLLILLLTISSTILLQGFTQLETIEVEKNITRLNNIFSDELERLFILAEDYGSWDDTYEYMNTHDEKYITTNFVESTFEDLNLNLMMLIDTNGNIVFERHYHKNKFDPKPSNLPIPKEDSNTRGLVLMSDEIMLLATYPVITSEKKGPSRGTLIMAYVLDEEEMDRISNLAQLDITVHRVDQPSFPKTNNQIQVIDEYKIAGYINIKDIYNEPAILLKLVMPRNIFRQGLNSLHYISIFVLSFAIILAGLILWLFERLVLSRLALLSQETENININNNLTVQGNDELDQLAMTINKMFAELQASNDKTLRLLSDNQFLVTRSIAIQEDERREISRELHDEFGQCLTAIQAEAENIIELVQTDNVRLEEKIIPSIYAIADTSSHIYNIVHSLMQQLRPTGLDELGLIETLHELTSTWQKRHRTTCILMVACDDLNSFGNNIDIMIYRIIQESLTNIAKHAQASQVIINLEVNLEKLQIHIQDNGCGMDINDHKRGLGLIGIRERIRSLDGEFHLDSVIDKGVKIALIIPITEKHLSKHLKWK